MGPYNLKHQLSATMDPEGWGTSGVVAGRNHGESRLVAGRVREVMAMPFLGAFVVIKG